MPTTDQYLTWLDRDVAGFRDVLETGDLNRPVPSCPGWRTADLAEHVGAVHRWAAAAIRTGAPQELEVAPAEGLAAWYAEGAADLLALLRVTDPATPAWTFGPKPRLAGFWHRRQAHEVAMHLWDARVAQGRPAPLDPELAVDGVIEIAEIMFPRQVRRGRIEPLPLGIRIVMDEAPDLPVVIAGDGTDPNAPTGALVQGPAVDVLLALWRRAQFTNLDIHGDPALAASVMRSAITP